MSSNILILIVVFLSITTIIGIVLYVYLYREQNKVIPAEQYNEARNEYSERKKLKSDQPLTISIFVSRIFLFYGTFIIVNTLLIWLPRVTAGQSPLTLGETFLFTILATPLIIVYFPAGIGAILMPNTAGESFWIGHLLYFVVCISGIFVKSRRAFIIIYLIFITLLMVNFVGCSKV